jgi:hypothetical protein
MLTLKTLASTSTQNSSDFEDTSQSTSYEVSAPVPIFPATPYGLPTTQSAPYDKPSGWVECDGATGSLVSQQDAFWRLQRRLC